MPGLHTFRITDDGVQVFPRIPQQQMRRRSKNSGRLGTGVPGLDELMGGGIPGGDAVMIAGPAGSGKTTFATQFVAEGLRQGEAVVVAVFEEYPEEYLARAKARNQHLDEALKAGKLKLIYLRPLDLSVDEALAEILDAVEQMRATRVVIDSLSGFEVALAPAFREDFRESLYRLIGALTAVGVTIVMTSEVVGGYPEVRYTSEKVSFITDDIIVQRFVEIGGELLKVLSVAKMRGSEHSSDFRLYQVSANGAVVSGSLRDYHGISTGVPDLGMWPARSGFAGLTGREAAVLDMIARLGEASLEMLVERTGIPRGELAPVIERLVALGYAAAGTGDDATVYRAPAQISG
jgi:circadian clock protein KaiC